MKNSSFSFVQRAFKEQSGQALIWAAFSMTLLLGMSAFVVDIGDVYYSQRQLQAATDAAALAGAAQVLASETTATAVAKNFSAYAGNYNTYRLQNVTFNATFSCVTTVTGETPCVAGTSVNAIHVVESAEVPMYFASWFGYQQMQIWASSTALNTQGSSVTPSNIAIIVDTTSSMNTTDSNCGKTRLACSEGAVQDLLQNIDPCMPGGGCTAADQVALFTFPTVTVGTTSKDTTCPSSNPTITNYTLPPSTITATTGYDPTGSSTGTYLITSYSNDYAASNPTTSPSTLIGTAPVSVAVGAGSCSGMKAPGGDGTYYAGVIYAAVASLLAQQKANPGSQNALIIISDGDANASSSKMGSGLTTTGAYPSAKDECQQAVLAGQYASQLGIHVYSIAYGSGATGCSTDSGDTNATAGGAAYNPCNTMSGIAAGYPDPSNPGKFLNAGKFYSDPSATGGDPSCVGTNDPAGGLNSAIPGIVSSLNSGSRLIPDGTT